MRPEQPDPRQIDWAQLVFSALIVGSFILGIYLVWKLPPELERKSPISFAHVGLDANSPYAGSDTCKDCHRADYDLWSQSHHALAERPVQPATDQIAFSPSRSFKHGSETTTVRIQNGEYQIVTRGLDGKVQPYRVERVFGHDPLEQFLTPLPGGRYQVQEASYDPKSNQWFYVYGDDLRFPGEFGHWTGRGMNWNSFCAECHNTRLHKNYDAVTDSYRTTMAEMAVGCEACHGPLKAHIEWQKAHPNTTLHDPTVVPLPPTRIVGLCGSCHSRNTDLTENFKPGDSFYDHYSLEILDYDQRWYPDGQIKDEDYEFEAFLGSKMYQDGVICLDCHNAAFLQEHTVRQRPLYALPQWRLSQSAGH